ncbi:hypothetical protein JOD63_000698 [Microbacterium terrae]|uniref:TIR domain-containing protein n=1 Tax=Microbacterium terrae TaxID=69369 RepID=A0A0M2HE71_9MICO|nr:SAVED domain-containing protein [Microbacterium terrae]7QQK_A Chain A, TIR_SAVED fusion protein [Microbacterium terrae]7QQK_B Chain B, TIR_SAVED fusion protein [Microbacterium terrae]7QQK_C Chain C, TIR_SAVED fusion protein [Microbacterium terrae]7QQK_D Chain D, TIR_SAVED fusion protein [Microbacterium terrae]KJL44934.1 hypothetical protein RS81_00402 [Microbacterium terrae]MBP1076730.1 hypothetical protein [Microbacterium terrae]GLJ97561.1 hypothetical protein GCM10017594_07580 [Microbac
MPDTAINPRDPVFVSYRHSDGIALAAELTWLLRAAGIPVWRDVDDLPPGDTDARLQQAIDEGISGAVIIITPQIADSRVVREVEAPRLLRLHRSSPQFALGIVNAIQTSTGVVDYDAPDRVLGMERPELRSVDQKSASRLGLVTMARQMLWHRIAAIRPLLSASGGELRLSLQTRNTPQVYDRTDADLDIRIRPSAHEKLPSAHGLEDFAETAQFLPDAVTRAGANGVRIEGGAHLSVSIAIGAAIPSTRVGPMTVVDGRGVHWVSSTEPQLPDEPRLRIVRESTIPSTAPAPGRPDVAAYIDLQHPRSDAAFDNYLTEHAAELVAWQHLAPTRTGLLDAADGGTIAAEAVAHIRELSMTNGNAVVHLMVRGPFGLAVLIGRLTNTLRVVAYEWTDSDAPDGTFMPPRYEPIVQLRASTPAGVIERVIVADAE